MNKDIKIYESRNWVNEETFRKGKRCTASAVSGIAKKYDIVPENIKTLETKYDDDAGDWYVALGWNETRAIIKMDSVQGKITEIKEI